MKNIKIYIVTYKRKEILNKTLDILFNKTDLNLIPQTEINILNNHTDFFIEEQFKSKVNIIHNQASPDWDTGNLARSWNQCLIHGFKDLNNPDAKIVVTMQNDIILEPNWATNLLKMHKKYSFITGRWGDNIVSYTAEAVKKIGMWDERFVSVCNKEADYWLRALIHNKNHSLINDIAHGRTLNNHDALPLDSSEYQGGEDSWVNETKKANNANEAWYHSTQILFWKWKDTWRTQPSYDGWLINWTKEFIENPPCNTKQPQFVQYYYFEKDIDLNNKNYVGWRKEDLWLDLNKRETIDVHPFKDGEKFH